MPPPAAPSVIPAQAGIQSSIVYRRLATQLPYQICSRRLLASSQINPSKASTFDRTSKLGLKMSSQGGTCPNT